MEETLRNRLIVTGAKEIAENGIAGFSLRKIASECGISCAAPYKHFKNTRTSNFTISNYEYSSQQRMMKKGNSQNG